MLVAVRPVRIDAGAMLGVRQVPAFHAGTFAGQRPRRFGDPQPRNGQASDKASQPF